MTPRIKITPYKDEDQVNGHWVHRIWLVTDEQTRHLGFASKTVDGTWRGYFSDPSSSQVLRLTAPTFRAVRAVVASAIGIRPAKEGAKA